MNNYEYIVASLPVITADFRGELDYDGVLADIKSQLSEKDLSYMELLLKGFDSESLTADFYKEALSSKCAFIREYFQFDLGVRNCKVEYLNKALGRSKGTDIMVLDPDADSAEFDAKPSVMAVLEKDDLLERERGLDDLMWDKIEDLTYMEVFSLNLILGFTAKLQIVARWLKLDPATGRELFKQLVNEIRNNKKELA